MPSSARNKATDRYRKRSVRQVIVRFYPKDEGLYAFVKERGGSAYLKELAAKARESDGGELTPS